MTDVVAVALISSGASLAAATVGAVTTSKVSRRNTEATIRTAESQKDVELARIEAENTRLREQHVEDGRRNRQGTYHKTLTVIQRIYGVRPGDDDLREVMTEWRFCRSGVQIFGSESARTALDQVHGIIAKRPEASDVSVWQQELSDAAFGFIAAVREDIGADTPTS